MSAKKPHGKTRYATALIGRTLYATARKAPCPLCGGLARWHLKRTTHPIDLCGKLTMITTIHHCEKCDFYFKNPKTENIIDSSGHCTKRLIHAVMALALVHRNLLTVERKARETFGLSVPIGTIHAWAQTFGWLPFDLWRGHAAPETKARMAAARRANAARRKGEKIIEAATALFG